MPDRRTRTNEDPASAPTTAPGRGMRVRVDSGRTPGAGPGRGSLLGAFRVAAEPEPERRAEDRHHQVECFAWVGWRSWRGFQMNDAVLINLSRGGTRVLLDTPPPTGRAVWLYMETPGRKAVVKARAVDVRATASGQCTVRIAFDEPCPYALFEAAVCGLAAADPKARLAPAPRVAPSAPKPVSARVKRKAVLS